jgi:hypothetical protein
VVQQGRKWTGKRTTFGKCSNRGLYIGEKKPPRGGEISADVIWGKKYEKAKRKRRKMLQKKEERGKKKEEREKKIRKGEVKG